MKPTPYQIAAFTHVARERSFSRAASSMGVSQSAITQHVAKLEKIMGAQLFLRRRDGVELTASALELFALTDRLRSLEEEVTERILDFGQLSSGNLKIIANMPRPALPIIARYGELYPDVRIEFSLVSWNMAMTHVQTRDVDIALIVEPDRDAGFFVESIGTTHYRAFVRTDHPLASRKSVTLKTLASEVVIVPEDGSLTQRVMNRKTAEYGMERPRYLKAATFPLVKEAVLHGCGVAVMLEDGQYPSTSLASLPIRDMAETYDIAMVTPHTKRDLRLVRSFWDVAMDVCTRTDASKTAAE